MDEEPDTPSKLFARQHGVAGQRQLRSVGITPKQQRMMIQRGVWEIYSPGVVALTGVPKSFLRSASAATLAPGASAALGAGAAARVHQLDGCLAVNEITVVVARNAEVRVPSDVKVIRSRRLTDDDVMVVDGIRVTSVALTLVHLQVHGPNAEKALDSALHKGHKPDELQAVFDRWTGHGRRGGREMRSLLQQRVDGRLPRSWFQRLAKRLLAEAGLAFEDEWPLYDASDKLIAEFDLALVDLKVGVECQSWEWHGSPAQRRKDTDRKRRVRKQGWEIVELWWSDLKRMDAVIEDILLVVARARIVARGELSG
jgi:hypothetical protein